ncbi:MAG: hypothetical protein KME13_11435 [Myxacorys californica WJT36-NPBG1]|jgi:hypothetical protein|nr:hypothetical protein [Myxacorys californica WJT36-NPBG1]
MLTNRQKRQLQRNKVNIGIGIVALIATVASIPNMAQNAQQMGTLREKMNAQTAEQMDILASEDDKTEKEKIADARYERGCIFVVALSDKTKLANIQEGRPVLDGVTKFPLAAGSVVCDDSGNTAEIIKGKPPTASKLAFTGNQEIVQKALDRARGNGLKRSNSHQSTQN